MPTNYGLKIAQPGKNVNQASDPQLVLSSQFSTLPVFKIISVEYALGAFDFTARTVKHGLPFVPFCLMFYKGSSNNDRYIWYPNSGAAIATSNDQVILFDKVDKENIVFTTESNIAGNSVLKVVIVVFAFPVALSI